jgi:GAF domain-containing protein
MAPHPIDPVAAFAELGRTKLSEVSLDGILGRVATMAKQTLPGAGEVSITLVREQGPYTAAHTGELALRLDERQYEQLQGPCLQAAAEKTTISVPHAAADTRWSGWALKAASAGVGSVLAVGLPIIDDVSGALNIYGHRPAAFDGEAIRLAQTFAGYAAVALANAYLYHSTADLARHLQTAMDSRAVIEQAKGIVMAERRCTADEAFAFLTAVSQETNRKVRDVAAALVAGIRRPAS